MIYPCQYLVRTQILPGLNYQFVVEQQLTVRWLAEAWIIFHNPLTAPNAGFKVVYSVAQSSVFSDTYTVVDETVTPGSIYEWEVKKPLVQSSSRTTHAVTMTNHDSVSRWMYCLITGWTDTKLTLPSTVYAIGAEGL